MGRTRPPATYAAAGVDTHANAAGLGALLRALGRTSAFRKGGVGTPLLEIGFFASVLRLSERLSLAISTDGVGSKSLVAQALDRYEAIGWDCVAVNVNDVICVGAEPIALVDYIAYEQPKPRMLAQLGRGMRAAARRAGIAIVGGEMSQHPDSLAGLRAGYAFDIAGTCVGVLEDRAPIIGSGVKAGDVVIGLASDGIHANGLTLARHALLGDDPSATGRALPGTAGSVGEELLLPTHIYVPEVLALLRAGADVRGLVHVSGDGLLNLCRLDADVSYRLDALPPVPAVFRAIQRAGGVDDAEMYRVFNMGVGFCVVVPATAADGALRVIRACGTEAWAIGGVTRGRGRRVLLPQQRLVGEGGGFTRAVGRAR